MRLHILIHLMQKNMPDESKIDGEYAELVNKKIEEADKAYEESQKKNYA